jgi:hypothetical protein
MLNILSGYKTANIKSFPVAAGVLLEEGDWVVFDTTTTGNVTKPTATYVAKTHGMAAPVFRGNKIFYDTKSLGRVDVVTANSGVLETDKFAATAIKAGSALGLNDKGQLDPVATDGNGDGDIVAYAIAEPANGVLQFVFA